MQCQIWTNAIPTNSVKNSLGTQWKVRHKSSGNIPFVSVHPAPLPTRLHIPLLSPPESNKMTDRNLLFPLSHFVPWRCLWHQESDAVCFFSSWFAWQSLLSFLPLPSGFGSVWTETPRFPGSHQSSHQTDLTDLPPSAILLPVLPLSKAKRKRHKRWLSSTVKHTGR